MAKGKGRVVHVGSKKKSKIKPINQADVQKVEKTIRSMKNFNKRSKYVRFELLEGKYSERQGIGVQTSGAYNPYYIYDIPASKVTDEEIKRMAKLANDRLYKLEKSGQSEYSREYQIVEHYAVGEPNGKGSIYNVSDDLERIRFTSSAKGMDSDERRYYVNTLRNFLRAETSTVTGTKAAINKAYKTFMSGPTAYKIPDMKEADYKRLWKTYRDSVLPDKMTHEGYNAFIELIANTNLYQLDDDQMMEAVKYVMTSKARTVAGRVGGAIDEFDFLHN